MSGGEHIPEAAVEATIDAWAHSYASDAWRALTADEQMDVGRDIIAAALPHLVTEEAVERGHTDPTTS